MLQRNSNQVEHMNQISEHIWLGDYVSTSQRFRLNKVGITHILTVGSGLPPKNPNHFKYLVINVWDDPKVNLK
jgi:hypothetical protein